MVLLEEERKLAGGDRISEALKVRENKERKMSVIALELLKYQQRHAGANKLGVCMDMLQEGIGRKGKGTEM